MSPPRLADRFLNWFCAPHLREEVLGDLHERYVLRVQQLGETRARRRYWRDVLAYVRPDFIRRKPDQFPTPTNTTMLFNYLKVAYRNLINNKVFSAINVTGLALGIACSIMLFLFVLDELNYDTFTKKANHTYRLYVHSLINGNESNSSKTAAQAGNVLVRHFPEVLTSTRIGYFGDHDLRYGDKVFRETKIYTADSTYFDVFSLPFLYGNPATALKNPNTIVLTETMARKYFDDQNPVGKAFIADGHQSYKITGVMKDFPDKSHFRCDFLLSMSTYPEVNQQNWLEANYSTYVVLKDGIDPDRIEQKMKPLILEYVGPQVQKALGVPIESFLAKGNAYEYRLQPLSSIYLHSKRQYAIDPNTEWSGVRIGDSAYLYIFLAVAFFMLLIAVINFINLSTARSESRAKEVGIRKTIGSNRAKLIGQFITESVLLTGLAVLIALLIVTLLLPGFNEIAGRHLQLALFSNAYRIPALFAFILLVGMLAGSYPAFFLSSFQPIDVLKSGVKKRKSSLRSFLVVTQFSIAIVLILGMIIIRSQLQYIQQKNLGFHKEHILSINNAAVLGDKLRTFKAELLQNSAVLAASNTSQLFTTGIPGRAYLFGNQSGTDPISFQFLDVDQDFVETFGVQLTSGRFFEKGRIADSTAVVINEAAFKECKAKNVLNLELTKVEVEDIPKTYKIVGVVKDFNYESLHRGVRPLLFHLRPVQQATSMLHIRIRPNATQKAIDHIESTWRKFEKAEQCQYSFLDESLGRLYDEEQKTSLIATIFSFLSILIACMGLFGLAIFVTEQRTKEIGIRKVLGASISEILFLLSKQFISWVMIAMLIASPIAWYAMNQWLQNFAYRTDISWWMFVGAGTLAIGVALCTVSFHSIKAALKNPVKSLRSE